MSVGTGRQNIIILFWKQWFHFWEYMGTRPLYCIFTGPSFAAHEFESPVWTELGALHVIEGGRTLGPCLSSVLYLLSLWVQVAEAAWVTKIRGWVHRLLPEACQTRTITVDWFSKFDVFQDSTERASYTRHKGEIYYTSKFIHAKIIHSFMN